MKKIPLTQGKVALVDDEDYERINAHKWQAKLDRTTNSYYAVRSSPRDESGKRPTIRMHREIMNAKPGEQVDHINRDTLDNQQKSNLRICTASQNSANKGLASTNKSGYKGVDWHKKDRKWRARVSVNGESKFIGNYATAREAALAYDKAAVEYHGMNANTNAMMGLIG